MTELVAASGSGDPRPRILIVDDEPAYRSLLRRRFSRRYELVEADGGETAIEKLRDTPVDLVLCDYQMPGRDGLDVVRYASTQVGGPPVVVLTGFGTVKLAVDVMRSGATAFLEKDGDLTALSLKIDEILAERRAAKLDGRPAVSHPFDDDELVGSDRWREPFTTTLRRFARTREPVLMLGETGTGKSLVARRIWQESERAEGPFVTVDCSVLHEHLMESELFGHVKGAFTSADSDREGKVAAAEGGTLFIDEIGDLPEKMQPKLLRLIQERRYAPVGGTVERRADVRFVIATNADLERMVAARSFRMDLYFRIKVLTLKLPPLRERREDISLLFARFARRLEARQGYAMPRFTAEAMELLQHTYEWPGNVRELEAVLLSAAIRYPPPHRVTPQDLIDGIGLLIPETEALAGPRAIEPIARIEPRARGTSGVRSTAEPPQPAPAPLPAYAAIDWDKGPIDLGQHLESIERSIIAEALERTGSNVTKAAELLGRRRTTLIEAMKRLGLKVKRRGDEEAPEADEA